MCVDSLGEAGASIPQFHGVKSAGFNSNICRPIQFYFASLFTELGQRCMMLIFNFYIYVNIASLALDFNLSGVNLEN